MFRDVVRGQVVVVSRGWSGRAEWERVPNPNFRTSRESAHFRAWVLDNPGLSRAARDAPKAPAAVFRISEKRYAFTRGQVTVIGIGEEKMLTLIAVVVRDPARSDDD